MSVKATVKPSKIHEKIVKPSDCSIQLCDKNHSQEIQQLADYLIAASATGHVLYGHQNEFTYKAGQRGQTPLLRGQTPWKKNGKGGQTPLLPYSSSDTHDITGYFAPVSGLDALSLTGCEYGKWYWSQKKRVRKAVKLVIEMYKKGSFLSFSLHMPNFEQILHKEPLKLKDSSYNFSGYSPNDRSGKVVQDIIEGKKLKELYLSYLDMVCDFLAQLQKKKFPVIFRPFHENTGGWFWWGKDTCSPEEFKKLWSLTYDYVVNTKNIHNLIWAYSPGSEPKSKEEFAERYPGDEYVDLIGLDMYERFPEQKDTFFELFNSQLKLHSSFAKEHKKLFACTETGVAHENNKALLEEGNEDLHWYEKVLDACVNNGACYFLLWANFSRKGAYYSPFVEIKNKNEIIGHEMLDSFINMFNSPHSVFKLDY